MLGEVCPPDFDEAQLAELQRHLGLDTADAAFRASRIIGAQIVICRMFEEGTHAAPSVANLKERHKEIADLATRLIDLLKPPTRLRALMTYGDERDNRADFREVAEPLAMKAVATLLKIQLRSEQLSRDEEDLRRLYDLMSVSHLSSPYAVYLWPKLFKLWVGAGKQLATTKGPLFRFVSFVHEVFAIAPPAVSTLRDHVRAYRAAQPGSG